MPTSSPPIVRQNTDLPSLPPTYQPLNYQPPTYQPPTHHISPEDLFINPKQHPAPPARKILSPHCIKRQRLSPSDDTRRSPGRQQQTAAAKRTTTTTIRPSPSPPTPKLNRCHICSRKPTKKSDLDSFADCEACGQRTCYVCIRQCLGWRKDGDDEDQHHKMDEDEDDNGKFTSPPPVVLQLVGGQGVAHKKVVCSGCCVERGVDGEVVCLGCLPYAEG